VATERIVKHQGTAIMLRNAGEPAVSYQGITDSFKKLGASFEKVKESIIATGEAIMKMTQS
jgi:hypothetical protein